MEKKSKEKKASPTTSDFISAGTRIGKGLRGTILSFTHTPGRSHGEKCGISFPVVKELGKPIEDTYQKVILQVLTERGEESEAHHENHGLGGYHNRGKAFDQIYQTIPGQGDWEMSA